MNSPSWLQPGFGHKSRPWVEGAAAGRRWKDTTHMRRSWVNGGATGRNTWYRVLRARSCSNPEREARSRGESTARSLRHRAMLSWSLRCHPLRNAARWCSAHRREQRGTPGTQSLKEQERRRQTTYSSQVIRMQCVKPILTEWLLERKQLHKKLQSRC